MLHCVLILSKSANNFAQKQKRKTLTASDVFEALEEMEFSQFIKPLKDNLACEYDSILSGLYTMHFDSLR